MFQRHLVLFLLSLLIFVNVWFLFFFPMWFGGVINSTNLFKVSALGGIHRFSWKKFITYMKLILNTLDIKQITVTYERGQTMWATWPSQLTIKRNSQALIQKCWVQSDPKSHPELRQNLESGPVKVSGVQQSTVQERENFRNIQRVILKYDLMYISTSSCTNLYMQAGNNQSWVKKHPKGFNETISKANVENGIAPVLTSLNGNPYEAWGREYRMIVSQ